MPSFLISTKACHTGIVTDTCATMAILRVLEAGCGVKSWEVVAEEGELIADAQNQKPENQ